MQNHALKASKGIGPKTQKSLDSDTVDAIFDLLSSSRRRSVISIVLEHGNIGRKELTELVTQKEYGLTADQVRGSPERQTIHTSLYQTHLPKLDEHKAIVWNRESDRIRIGPEADLLAEWFSAEEQSIAAKARSILSI